MTCVRRREKRETRRAGVSAKVRSYVLAFTRSIPPQLSTNPCIALRVVFWSTFIHDHLILVFAD